MKIDDILVASQSSLGAAGSASPGFSAKLQQAAQELEAGLLHDVFSKLRKSFSLDQQAASDPGHGSLSDLADEALCSSVAARGGLGIAKLISQRFAESSPKVPAETADESLERATPKTFRKI